MMNNTRHSHTNYKMVIPYIESAEKNNGCIRCTASGFMDLCIEKLWFNDCFGNPVYSIAHYGHQNGDSMRDPDIEFSVDRKSEKIIPLSFRNDYMNVYQEVVKEINGKNMYSPSLLRDLDEFFWQWMKNIGDQGFSPEIYDIVD